MLMKCPKCEKQAVFEFSDRWCYEYYKCPHCGTEFSVNTMTPTTKHIRNISRQKETSPDKHRKRKELQKEAEGLNQPSAPTARKSR